jgi:hypothetical protein
MKNEEPAGVAGGLRRLIAQPSRALQGLEPSWFLSRAHPEDAFQHEVGVASAFSKPLRLVPYCSTANVRRLLRAEH